MTRPKPPTPFERRVLEVLLCELRRAMRSKAQLSILVDPFVAGGGTYIFAGPNEQGRSYSFDGDRDTKPSNLSRSKKP